MAYTTFCIGVSVGPGSCPKINSMLKALVIGPRSMFESELMVSITLEVMMIEGRMIVGMILLLEYYVVTLQIYDRTCA